MPEIIDCCRRGYRGLITGRQNKSTRYTKPEVFNILQCRHRKTEPRQYAQKFIEFGRVIFPHIRHRNDVKSLKSLNKQNTWKSRTSYYAPVRRCPWLVTELTCRRLCLVDSIVGTYDVIHKTGSTQHALQRHQMRADSWPQACNVYIVHKI